MYSFSFTKATVEGMKGYSWRLYYKGAVIREGWSAGGKRDAKDDAEIALARDRQRRLNS